MSMFNIFTEATEVVEEATWLEQFHDKLNGNVGTVIFYTALALLVVGGIAYFLQKRNRKNKR